MEWTELFQEKGKRAAVAAGEARVRAESVNREVAVRFTAGADGKRYQHHIDQFICLDYRGIVQLIRMYGDKFGYTDIIEELGK